MHLSWKKNTAVFIISQIVSLFGSSLVQYAMTWHITLTTGSGVYAAIAIVCGFVPTFLLSPFAGVWADRYNRKYLIIVADGFIALSTLILALLFMAGYEAIWLLFAAMALRAFGAAVQTPCVGAMLPDIVPSEHLTRVNGINRSFQSLTMIASPMLSGALLGLTGIENIFMIDVVTAAAAIAVMLAFLKLPEKAVLGENSEESGDYLEEMRRGFRYIGSQAYLKVFFVYLAVFYFMAVPTAFLTPLQVVRVFGNDVWRLTAIEMVFAVGMILGGLIIAAWGGFRNRVVTMSVTVFFMSIAIVLLGFPHQFGIYLGVMGFAGVTMSIFDTPATVLLQQRVAPEYLGRVFGVMTMLSTSLMPFGMLVFGPVADYIAIEYLLIGSGIVIMLLSFGMLFSKSLRAAGEPVTAGASET